MKLKALSVASLVAYKADVILVGVFAGEQSKVSFAAAGNLSLSTARQAQAENFGGNVGETLVRFTDGSLAAPQAVLFGLGARDKANEASFRKALTAALKKAKALKAQHVAFAPLDPDAVAGSTSYGLARTIALYAGMVDYVMNHQKTVRGGHKQEVRFKKLHFIVAADQVEAAFQGLKDGFAVASAVNFARDLSNEPAGTLTPAKMVKLARKTADDVDTIETTVYGPKELKKMGANALLAVGRGSDEPCYLIDMVYTPADGHYVDELTIIGKSVTFDSGGLDIKPADGMRHMKRDMSGGAVTLGAIKAIAALSLPIKVRCVMAPTENMINGSSYKPGDVIHTMAGLTVEVDNTDAEGRLTLADAIEYAKRQGAKKIIDLATLTGAVRMMVGDVGCCLFTNNDDFGNAIVASGFAQGEKMLNVPMWEEYRDLNKSEMADLKNSGGAPGSTTAAYFLREFAGEEIAWAHLDIASVAFRDRELGADPRGSTGFGVRTLVEFASRLAGK
jgi:leucyl aminopeptidase